MSRCFPFPPPGYEKRLRVDDGNLLAKEKNKEKKHKKERSKEKHRDKSREKKEKRKHRDNDNDKKKDTGQSRDKKRLRSEDHVEKFGSYSSQSSQLTGSSFGQVPDGRSSYVDGSPRNQSVNSINDIALGTGEPLGNLAPRNKAEHDQKANGKKDTQTRFLKLAIVSGVNQRKVQTTKEQEKQKYKDEMRFEGGEVESMEKVAPCRRNRDENCAAGSQVIAKVNSATQKRVESIMANGNVTFSLHEKETTNFGNGIHRRENGDIGNNNLKSARVAFVQNSKVLERRGCEMIGHTDMGKKVSFKGPEKNAYGGLGLGSDVMGDKEKKIRPTNEGRSKVWEEKKEKQRGDIVINLSRLGQRGEDSTDTFKQSTLKASNNSAKEMVACKITPEANGFSYGNERWPNKLSTTVASALQPFEDGRNLQTCQTVTLSAPKQGKPDSLKLDIKGLRGNEMIRNEESSLKSIEPPLTIAKANTTVCARESRPQKSLQCITQESPGAFLKAPTPTVETNETTTSVKPKHKPKEKPPSKLPPPHPDAIYFSKLLSLPKMDAQSGFDDQEWLFETSEKTKRGSSAGREDLQVWSKVVYIEPADVYALPYVIPY